LYGSIGVTEIQSLLAENGHQIEKRAINIIDGPIREVGQYQVLITYHADVQESINVNILSDVAPQVSEETSEHSEG
jgi:large subunit ribosomal protein L9